VHNNDQYKRMIRSKTNYPIVSQPYKINNKNICNGVEKVSVIVMVHTAPRHFLTRLRMRTTWLNSTYYSPENVRVIFLLGSVFDPMLQYQIEEENKTFKGIVQGQFIDSYRNLTNKGVMYRKTAAIYMRVGLHVSKFILINIPFTAIHSYNSHCSFEYSIT
jgi:beta-1,3-galactosyltransferase 1